jgi:hypothetical protein
MVGRPKSLIKKTQISCEEKEKVMACAVVMYQAELAKPSSEKKQGLHKVCMDVQKAYIKETG